MLYPIYPHKNRTGRIYQSFTLAIVSYASSIRTNRPKTGLEPATRFRRSSVELLRHVMP